jgi:LysR family glycine cleavage system transcriptional activator
MVAQAAPICSPVLLEGEHGIRTLDALRHHTLLHERDYREWTEWLTAAGVPEVDGQRGPVIDNPGALLSAALEGHGVTLGIPQMLTAELKSGALVAPFGITPDPNFAYYLAYLPDALERPKVRAFRDFIIDELDLSQIDERAH